MIGLTMSSRSSCPCVKRRRCAASSLFCASSTEVNGFCLAGGEDACIIIMGEKGVGGREKPSELEDCLRELRERLVGGLYGV